MSLQWCPRKPSRWRCDESEVHCAPPLRSVLRPGLRRPPRPLRQCHSRRQSAVLVQDVSEHGDAKHEAAAAMTERGRTRSSTLGTPQLSMHPCTPKPMVAISRLVSTHLWLHSGHCSCEHRSSQLRRAALRNSVCCELYACWQVLVVVRSDCGCDDLLVLARRPSLNTPWPCSCSGHSEPASVATTARRIELRGRLRATRCCGWKYLLFVRRNEGLHPSGLCKATGASGCARQPTRNAKKKKRKAFRVDRVTVGGT